MNSVVVNIQTREPQWHSRDADLTIGKDILELLSTSMYVEPMTLYREYIQNAADSVDEACARGILDPSNPGRVQVLLDATQRTVIIRDNGTGIPTDDFEGRLISFGASRKRGTGARGFRGVGRLAAIGSCQELIFRSKCPGESAGKEMKWDCRKVRMSLRSAERLGLQQVVDSCVQVRSTGLSQLGEHGFEVELRGVVRHRNDNLLSPEAIYDYLSQVAPVPFLPSFSFAPLIQGAISSAIGSSSLHIEINGYPDPVYRPHRDEVTLPSGDKLHFTEFEPIRILTNEGENAAVGWVLHHDYRGAIPLPQLRGLRIRTGNMQVGGNDLLASYFQEPRFNAWSVGEIHTTDQRIVPNGRRDHFEQNAHFDNLVNHLSVVTRVIGARCRESSTRRNWLRRFAQHGARIQTKLRILQQGSVGSAGAQLIIAEMDIDFESMRKIAAKDILPPGVRSGLEKELGRMGAAMRKVASAPQTNRKLKKLSSVKRHIYENAFSLIYKHCPEEAAARKLVAAILSEL